MYDLLPLLFPLISFFDKKAFIKFIVLHVLGVLKIWT